MAGEESFEGIRARYTEVEPRYKALTTKVRDLVAELIATERVLSVTGRTKDQGSFVSKALRHDDQGKQKYTDPFKDITDISGVRVICYTLSQATAVCDVIRSNFDVVEYIDKAAELRGKRKLGYTSIHLLSRFSADRARLPEYKSLEGLLCEIQVRTILQHAWAELEHRVQYKKESIDDNLYERFLALAGLIQIADREFEGIVDINNGIEAKISADLQTSDPSAAEEVEPQRDRRRNPVLPGASNHKLHRIKFMFGAGPAELLQNGEYAKAEAVYSEFIAAQPSQWSHFEGRAKARALMGRIEEAKEDLRKALKLHPNDPRLEAAVQRLEQPNG
jgi:putative GTP pyrophosphokinase